MTVDDPGLGTRVGIADDDRAIDTAEGLVRDGQALLGKHVNDEVVITAGEKTTTVRVVSIRYET